MYIQWENFCIGWDLTNLSPKVKVTVFRTWYGHAVCHGIKGARREHATWRRWLSSRKYVVAHAYSRTIERSLVASAMLSRRQIASVADVAKCSWVMFAILHSRTLFGIIVLLVAFSHSELTRNYSFVTRVHGLTEIFRHADLFREWSDLWPFRSLNMRHGLR